MESRHDIYYSGNTVKPPRPSGKNLKRRWSSAGIKTRQVSHDPKICLTNECVWCQKHLGQYMAVCIYCHNCQYCGLNSHNMQVCGQCGNHVDEKNNKVTIFRAV